MKALISVIVPVFNSEQHIKKCIESIQNQTYTNLEIILIDDGSTDTSGNICDEYASLDDRIVVVHQKNRGVVRARKAGISMAKGEYIGFVDSDDFVDEGYYLRLQKLIEDECVDFVHSGFFINEEYYGYKETKKVVLTNDNRVDVICDVLFGHNHYERMLPSIWSKLFRASICKEAHGDVPDELSYGEDLIHLCNCLLKSDSFLVLNESYYHYLVHKQSLSHKVDAHQIEKEIRLYETVCRLLSKYRGVGDIDDCLNHFLLEHIFIGLDQHPKLHGHVSKYSFSNIDILFGKRIVIFGAGRVGKDYYSQIRRYSQCRIVAWIDRDACLKKCEWFVINEPSVITSLEYDYVILAVNSLKARNEMMEQLTELHIEKEKIIWDRPMIIYE